MADAATAMQGKHVKRGVICALLGGTFWGFSGTCAQLLMNTYDIPALWVTCVRLAIAAAVFLPVALFSQRKALFAVFRDTRSLAQIVGFAVLGVVLSQVSYLFTISNTNAGTATVLQEFGLIIIMVYSCLRVKRAPNVKEIAGLVCALAGVICIATQGDFSSLSISPAGLMWGLIASFGLAFYTLMPARVLVKWGSMVVTGLAMLTGGVLMAAAVRPWEMQFELSPGAIAALIALVLVGTFLAYLLYLQGVKDAGPVRAGMLSAMEPVSALVIGIVWLHNDASIWDIAGCAFVLIMIILVAGSTEEAVEPTPTKSDRYLGEPAIAYGVDFDDTPMFAGRASMLGYYRDRRATREDYETVSALLDMAHDTFAKLGIDEGRKKYPSPRRLMKSINAGSTYLIEDIKGRPIACFAVGFSPDKVYQRGIDGEWLTDTFEEPQPYAELRWVSVHVKARRRGVGMFVLDRAENIARKAGRKSLRADTYELNIPMHKLLEKDGYKRCGVVTIRDVFEHQKRRIAFEKLL